MSLFWSMPNLCVFYPLHTCGNQYLVEFISIPPVQVHITISGLWANRVGKIFGWFLEYLVDFISIPPVQVHFTISSLGANRTCLTFALFLLHFFNREQYYKVTGEEFSKNITCFLNHSICWWTRETERNGRTFLPKCHLRSL